MCELGEMNLELFAFALCYILQLHVRDWYPFGTNLRIATALCTASWGWDTGIWSEIRSHDALCTLFYLNSYGLLVTIGNYPKWAGRRYSVFNTWSKHMANWIEEETSKLQVSWVKEGQEGQEAQEGDYQQSGLTSCHSSCRRYVAKPSQADAAGPQEFQKMYDLQEVYYAALQDKQSCAYGALVIRARNHICGTTSVLVHLDLASFHDCYRYLFLKSIHVLSGTVLTIPQQASNPSVAWLWMGIFIIYLKCFITMSTCWDLMILNLCHLKE